MESIKRYSMRTRSSNAAALAKTLSSSFSSPQTNNRVKIKDNSTGKAKSQNAVTPDKTASCEPEIPVTVKLKYNESSVVPIEPFDSAKKANPKKAISPNVTTSSSSSSTPSEHSNSFSIVGESSPPSTTNAYESMFKTLFKKSPKRYKNTGKAKKSTIITSAHDCFPYAYYRKRKSNSISAKNVKLRPVTTAESELDDSTERPDYLDWKLGNQRQDDYKKEITTKKDISNKRNDNNGDEEDEQINSSLTESTVTAPANESMVMMINQEDFDDDEMEAVEYGLENDKSEMIEGGSKLAKMAIEERNVYDELQDDYYEEDEEGGDDEEEENNFFEGVPDFFVDFSSEELEHHFESGICACKRCISSSKFVDSLEQADYIEEILSKREAYPNLARLVQRHLDKKAKKNLDVVKELAKQSNKMSKDNNSTDNLENVSQLKPTQPTLTLPPSPSKKNEFWFGNDSTNPNKVIILKKELGNGQFSYRAVPQGLLKPPSLGIASKTENQNFIRFVSNTPLHSITTNSLVRTVATLADKPAKPTAAAASSKTPAAATATTPIATTSNNAKSVTEQSESADQEEEPEGDLVIDFREKEEKKEKNEETRPAPVPSSISTSLTVYHSEPPENNEKSKRLSKPVVQLPFRPDLKNVQDGRTTDKTSTVKSSHPYQKKEEEEEEDESFELCYTTGQGKTPLIITLYIKCPLDSCTRLFNARNRYGGASCSRLHVSYLIAQHLRKVHRIAHPSQCLLCGRRFPKDHLKWHVRSVHETGALNERFPCRLCFETYFDSYEKLVKHHTKRHVQGRYMCAKEGCQQTAHYRIDIYRHQAKAHNEHRCAQCGLTFQYRSTLTRHELLHADRHKFACRYGQCLFTTTSKGGCLQHVRVRHLGLPLLKRGGGADPNKVWEGEDHRRLAALEKEALSYVWYFDDEQQRLVPTTTGQRAPSQPTGPIRTVRKKVLVVKRKAGAPLGPRTSTVQPAAYLVPKTTKPSMAIATAATSSSFLAMITNDEDGGGDDDAHFDNIENSKFSEDQAMNDGGNKVLRKEDPSEHLNE